MTSQLGYREKLSKIIILPLNKAPHSSSDGDLRGTHNVGGARGSEREALRSVMEGQSDPSRA